MAFESLDRDKFINGVRLKLDIPLRCSQDVSTIAIDSDANKICDILCSEYLAQGKSVNSNKNKTKEWWNKKELNPIMKERNRVRQLLLTTRSLEAMKCYQEWQLTFKKKVEELKRKHWRSFLASEGINHAFHVFKFTKQKASCDVAPLKKSDGRLTTDKKEKTELLFNMFSQAGEPINLANIQHESPLPPFSFREITTHEIMNNIKSLPNKKASGPDKIPNKIIKLSGKELNKPLKQLFNSCLSLGHFPQCWKLATTVILQKANKKDYSDPSAYRPIALLGTIGKLFERIINKKIMYWEHKSDAISEGHFGGRQGRNIDKALLTLDLWIKDKWRKNKTVIGLFLDVKSAYPAVH
ncbi:hypothetical protein O181_105869 [Austropuccinia psidii MF-1]|uniref:Reverse transcriptase domain-containing protein n=1 Tax=Austropuccinia psidii MF-1 TaxID=1389203 RepID=A0A9Q3JR00_9BASI|nr:hypothetical protein [Austropuccinia psidii MF-1]